MMQLSPAGLAFVEAREHFEAKAYPDSAGVPTIGYGSTGPDIRLGMVWTQAQAAVRLRSDLARASLCVNAHVRVVLTQGEFDALTDFAYNVGDHAFATSTLLAKLNAGDYPGADAQFQAWDKAEGRVIAGLETRRLAEAEMFNGRAA